MGVDRSRDPELPGVKIYPLRVPKHRLGNREKSPEGVLLTSRQQKILEDYWSGVDLKTIAKRLPHLHRNHPRSKGRHSISSGTAYETRSYACEKLKIRDASRWGCILLGLEENWLELKNHRQTTGSSVKKLSPREVDVLITLAKGLTVKEVGNSLQPPIGQKSVETHIASLMKKFAVATQIELLLKAFSLGMLNEVETLDRALNPPLTKRG
jgi:DNA-binding CsgD family transcriptional regulator